MKPIDLDMPTSLEGSELVFKGKRFTVNRVQLQGRSGKQVNMEAVVHPGAVLILPFLDDNSIIMIRNERFCIGKTLWELPAGTLEPNEAPEVTASRELIEETGYHANDIKFLTSFYTTPGFCTEVIYSYIAHNLNPGEQQLEDSENITVEIVPLSRAIEMVGDGTICDGKTILTLLQYERFFVCQ